MVFGRPISPSPLLDLSVTADTQRTLTRIRRHVDDLSTGEITLYPEGAQVKRAITDVVLEPGKVTELEILGITPTADEHAVRFSGDLAAHIIDFTVELIENTKVVFRDKDDDQDETMTKDEDVPQHIKDLEAELHSINDKIIVLDEESRALDTQTSLVEKFCQAPSQAELSPEQFMKAIDLYRDVCDTRIDQSKGIKGERRRLEGLFQSTQKEYDRRKLEHRNEIKRKKRQEAKDKADEESRKKEKKTEEQHLKEEGAKYIPKKVYRVVVKLEKPPNTPADSPAAENASANDLDVVDTETVTANELILTYNTSDAYWNPTYDINLDTTSSTGLLTYTAELCNKTSETWADCQIVLSTSEVTHQSLYEQPPSLSGWRIQLVDHGSVGQCRLSNAEQRAAIFGPRISKNRHRGLKDHLFYGRGETFGKPALPQVRYDPQPAAFVQISHNQVSAFGHQNNQLAGAAAPPPPPPPQAAPAPPRPPPPGAAPRSAGMPDATTFEAARSNAAAAASFGRSQGAAATPAPGASPFGLAYAPTNPSGGPVFGVFGQAQNATPSEAGFFAQTQPQQQQQTVQPSATSTTDNDIDFSDHGLTSTYVLPAPRTLAPSSLSTRHKLATTLLTNIKTTHLAIPKLNPAAFLRAKIPLPANVPRVFEGAMAGITIDSAFLGRIALPPVKVEWGRRTITLNLGVDPGVQVHYATPTANDIRARMGLSSLMGTGDKTTAYTRCTTIKNNKSAMVKVKVLDQVPVSADLERMKIRLLEPSGIAFADGERSRSVFAGVEARMDADNETDDDDEDDESGRELGHGAWGEASAKMNEDGEIEWEVELEAGRACKLPLRYEITVPKGEAAVSAS